VSLPARAGLVPPGTVPVAAGLAVLGGGSYAQLAVAGHLLDPGGMAAMSVLWSIVFVVGSGLFFPVEQELIRHVAERRARGEGAGPAAARATAVAAAITAAALVLLAAIARPLAGRLFGGREAMVAVLAAAIGAAAISAVTRGVLAGMGRFGAYGGQLGADGGLRLLLSGALGVAGSHSVTAFGLTLTAAPLLAAVVTAGPVRAALHPGPPLPWRRFSSRLGLLTGTMLLAQVMAYAAVIDVRLLAPRNPAVTGSVLAATVIARVPLFVFTSLQASLLPGLAGAMARGEQARFRQLLGRGCAAVTLLGVGAGLPAIAAGPFLARVAFAARPAPGRLEFAVLAAGTICYMLAMVAGQGAMVLGRHRDQLLAWLAGTAALAAVTLGPGPAGLRVVTAYAAGSATVAALLGLVLRAALSPGRAANPAADGPGRRDASAGQNPAGQNTGARPGQHRYIRGLGGPGADPDDRPLPEGH
jgi:O-antigen/teichoic acid export membrane protein